MSDEKIFLYAVFPPDGMDLHWVAHPVDSLATSPERAWQRFLYPSLVQKAYEKDGFHIKKMELKFDEGWVNEK